MEVVKNERLNIEVEIRFDKDTGDFFAEYQGQTFTSRDILTLRKDVSAAIEASGNLEWLPVMEITITGSKDVSFGGRRAVSYELKIGLSRYYVSRNPASGKGDWLKVEWDVPAEQRLARAEAIIPRWDAVLLNFDELPQTGKFPDFGSSRVACVRRYREDDWQTAVQAQEALRRLGRWLSASTLAKNDLLALAAMQVMLDRSIPEIEGAERDE